MNDSLYEKYSRQILFAGISDQGQQRLLASSAVIVGCGAIGAAAANLLVRAGVGKLRIIDRDFVEPSNLQRQTLFDEADALTALPKAIAAERKLRSINSSVSVEGIIADLSPHNAANLLSRFDLILDGTDNFETRFLINDFAVQNSKPWIYAAAVGSYGLTMTIRSGVTPCLSCLIEMHQHGLEETCDTVGILGPIVNLIASLEAADTLAQEGIEAEVIDLRTLLPLDRETILASVKRTNRLLIVHEDTRTGGMAGELAVTITESVFEYLDAPIVRVTAPDTPVPYSPPLEEAFLPNAAKVVEKARWLRKW